MEGMKRFWRKDVWGSGSGNCVIEMMDVFAKVKR